MAGEQPPESTTAAIDEEEPGSPTRLWVSIDRLNLTKPVTVFVEDVDLTRGATPGETTAVASVVSGLVADAIKGAAAYQKDQANVAAESVESVVAESIRTELQHKTQAPTHSKVPYTEVTLALIKPDALKSGHEREIRYTMQALGFVIVYDTQIQLCECSLQRSGRRCFTIITRTSHGLRS